MNPEHYYSEFGVILATAIRHDPVFQGREFYTEPSAPLQVGKIQYAKSGAIPVHTHNPIVKEIQGTTEVLFVLKGKTRVTLSGDGWEFQTVELGEGDCIILYPGGYHGLEMVEDTVLFEVKSGPYHGKEMEKTFLKGDDNGRLPVVGETVG